MPGGNRTGPMGNGPMTGRGMGPCSGNTSAGNGPGSSRWAGRGMAFGGIRRRGSGMASGRWFGFSRRNWTQPVDNEDELSLLKRQSDELSRSLKDIQQRIRDIESAQ